MLIALMFEGKMNSLGRYLTLLIYFLPILDLIVINILELIGPSVCLPIVMIHLCVKLHNENQTKLKSNDNGVETLQTSF